MNGSAWTIRNWNHFCVTCFMLYLICRPLRIWLCSSLNMYAMSKFCCFNSAPSWPFSPKQVIQFTCVFFLYLILLFQCRFCFWFFLAGCHFITLTVPVIGLLNFQFGSLQIWFSVSLIFALNFFENQHFE